MYFSLCVYRTFLLYVKFQYLNEYLIYLYDIKNCKILVDVKDNRIISNLSRSSAWT